MVLKNDSELLIKKFTVFLPFKSTCIQRSLTIYRYSARKGIKADFMVGVRLAPYMFHCWLTSVSYTHLDFVCPVCGAGKDAFSEAE